MNDTQRFQFAGEPEKCILCGAVMKKRRYPSMHLTTVICPNYGKAYRDSSIGIFTGTGAQHESYRMFDRDPELPEIFRPIRVGGMGPFERNAFYTTVIFLALVAIVAAAMSLLK